MSHLYDPCRDTRFGEPDGQRNPTQPTAPASMAMHTPTPWQLSPDDKTCIWGHRVNDATGITASYFFTLAETMGYKTEREANAAFIVRACNSHAQLVDALDDCQGVLDYLNRQLAGKSVAVRIVLDKARAALTAAQE